MIAYIDDSGDFGSRYAKGASEMIVLSMVCISEDKVIEIDKEMKSLKSIIGFRNFEFHFKENTERQRKLFLQLIRKTDFTIYALVLDKQSVTLKNKKHTFLFSVSKMLNMADEITTPKKIVSDRMLGKKQITSVAKQIKEQFPGVRSLHEEDSKNNNLVQLADYIASIIYRHAIGKDKDLEYFSFIRNKRKEIVYN